MLLAVHDAFRRELSIVRREFAESGPTLAAQLKVNCLTACDGLHFHHTTEDRGLFPAWPSSTPAWPRPSTASARNTRPSPPC
ncbi:hypothetical protein ACFQVA_24420 [Actinomadura keratinilytica]